jgi:hypothetical protein
MIVKILNSQSKGHQSSGKFSISSVDCCWRRKYLELKGLFKEEYTEKTKRAFALGDLFHQFACREMIEKLEGTEWGLLAAEINIPQNHPDAKYISGRCDLMLGNSQTAEKVIYDVKSCSTFVFKKAQEGDVPQNYQNQIQLYLHFFNIERGFLLFFSKEKGEYTEFEIKRDPIKARKLIDDINNFYENYVLADKEPEPCDGKNGGFFECPACKDFVRPKIL